MILTVVLIGLIGSPASGSAQAAVSAPPSLPGPPPGAGSGYPAAAAGTVPPAGPVGPASTIPSNVAGPGLISGTTRIHGRTLDVMLACRSSGTASLSAADVRAGVLAHARYACVKGRAVAALKLRSGDVRHINALHSTIGGLTVGRGHATSEFSLTLTTGPIQDGHWSDGGLQCNLFGTDTPYLVAPDFRVTPSVVIDVRPWVAFYTAAAGWHWLGTAGLGQSNWYQWTATPTGVTTWITPAGALNPWTWAPISVHPGSHTYTVGVFEVEYLYFHPTYTWHYAPSQTSTGPMTTYCSFP